MKKSIYSILFCTISLLSFSQTNTLDNFLQMSELKHAAFGLSIRDAQGKVIIAHRPQLYLIPASTVKALTAMMAFEYLSEDFRYTTEFYLQGDVDDSGTLDGLIIKGTGDPSLCSKEFDIGLKDLSHTLYQVLSDNAVQCIEHISYIDPYGKRPAINPSWYWQDVANYYAGGTHRFNISDNSYKLCFDTRGTIGSEARLSSKPNTLKLTFDNQVRIAPKGSGDRSYIYLSAKTHGRIIRGTLPQGHRRFCIKGAIPDPNAYFVNYLFDDWSNRAIEIPTQYQLLDKLPENISLVHRIESPPLLDLLDKCLKKSINLYADAIMNSLSDALQLESPNAVLNHFLDDLSLDALSGIKIEDGSGLSARNAVCADSFTKILHAVQKKPWHEKFVRALALSGVDGTLKNRLKNLPKGIKVYAKTGSMTGVTGYCGYIYQDQKLLYSFALLVNNHQTENRYMRQKIDTLLSKLITELLR